MFDLTDAFACSAILLLSFLLFQWRKRSSFCRLMDKIPGYSGIEAIKVMSNMNSKGIDKFYQSYLEIVRSFESASKIYVWPYLFVTIRDAEDVKIILNDKNCNEKHLLHKRFFNDGLVTLFGEKYRLRKKVVKEAFYPAFVKGHLPTIVAKTMSCLNRLEATPRKGEFDILESIFDFTLDVFLSTTLGRGDVDDHLRQKYVEDAAAIKILLNEKMIKFWLFPPFLQLTSLHRRSKKLLNSMESFAEFMINDLESEYQRDPKAVLKGVEPLSYLTQLYTIRNTMTHQEVINEVISILFAGFETSGITIAAIVLCIAMHEDVQAKVVAELDEIFLFDDEINEEKLDKMIYMETVIKESMRLFPLSPMYGRQATEEVQLSKIFFNEQMRIYYTNHFF